MACSLFCLGPATDLVNIAAHLGYGHDFDGACEVVDSLPVLTHSLQSHCQMTVQLIRLHVTATQGLRTFTSIKCAWREKLLGIIITIIINIFIIIIFIDWNGEWENKMNSRWCNCVRERERWHSNMIENNYSNGFYQK